jgi:hypothetical protein
MAIIPSSFQRSRSKTDGSYTNVNRYTYTRTPNPPTCGGAYTLSTTHVTPSGSVTTKVIQDCVTPGFHALLKKRRFVSPLPVHIDQISTLKSAAPYDATASYTGGTCPGMQFQYSQGPIHLANPWTLVVPGWNETALNAVVNSAVAEARSATWDVLTDLAELKQTIQLFREGHALLGSQISQIAKYSSRYLRSPKAFAQAVSSGWLRGRYGVMPTLYSLQDAVETFNRAQRTYAFGRNSASESNSYYSPVTIDTGAEIRSIAENLTYQRVYRGHSRASFNVISDSFRFDPLTTAYELLTLSFVLDWFLDIGTWLEAVSPFAAGTTDSIMGSVQTTSTRTQTWAITTYNTPGIVRTGSYNCVTLTETRKTYDRFMATTSLPGWNPRLNLPRITDAIALAMGLRTRARSTLRV